MAFDANDLSPHEHFVVERTRLGEIADFTQMAGAGGAKPAVRAGFLRKLMLEIDPSWTVRTPGVRLKGARIEGALDLTDCSGAGGAGLPALALVECDIPEPVDLSHARLARLSFSDSRLTRLIAAEARIDGEFDVSGVAALGPPGQETFTANLRGVHVDGDFVADGAKFARGVESDEPALFLENASIAGSLLLDEGFDVFGCVWLVRAHIGGNFECDDGKFLNRTPDAKGTAIVAEGAEIGGDVFLRSGFLAEGEVSLYGARVRGDVDLENGLFRNEGGVALVLTDADIDGAVSCHGEGGGCKITGAMMIDGARLGRNLDLRGAEIVHRVGRDTHGRAVNATNVKIGASALFQGANIKGELLLADARISGHLHFGGGRFINAGGWAIQAPNVRIGSDLSFVFTPEFAPFGQKTVIEGGAMLDSAIVEGGLRWNALELRGPGPGEDAKGGVFSIEDASIRGPLHAKGLTTQTGAKIDVSGASCAALEDQTANGWGAENGWIDAEGFSYGRFENIDETWRTRLAWLKRTRRAGGGFSAQPYTQAAQTYARAGRREDARRIRLAQQDIRTRRSSAGPLTLVLSSLFGLVAGYGLAPIRVVRALVLFLAIGVAGVLVMNDQGALVTPRGQACNGAIEPALYAIDVALPIIDLGQERRCAPGRTARAELSPGTPVSPQSDWRWLEGVALWRWAHALYALLGAILSALTVITFSGILKPKDE